MATKSEQISEILRGLRLSSPEIIGSAVVDRDGFTIAFVAPEGIDEDLVGAMAATFHGAGERIAQEVMSAPMEQAFVKSTRGYVIMNAVGNDALLMLLVAGQARLGLIFLEIRRVVPDIDRILTS